MGRWDGRDYAAALRGLHWSSMALVWSYRDAVFRSSSTSRDAEEHLPDLGLHFDMCPLLGGWG